MTVDGQLSDYANLKETVSLQAQEALQDFTQAALATFLSPVSATAQAYLHYTGDSTDSLPHCLLIDAPQPAADRLGWMAQQAGGLVGNLPRWWFLSKLSAKLTGVLADTRLLQGILKPSPLNTVLSESLITGFGMNFLAPLDKDTASRGFLRGHLINGLGGALAFSMQTRLHIKWSGLSSTLSGALSGLVSGLGESEFDSLLLKGRLSSLEDAEGSASSLLLLGGTLGALRRPQSHWSNLTVPEGYFVGPGSEVELAEGGVLKVGKAGYLLGRADKLIGVAPLVKLGPMEYYRPGDIQRQSETTRLLQGEVQRLSLQSKALQSRLTQLEDAVSRDHFTGLYDKYATNQALEVYYRMAREKGKPFAVIGIDGNGLRVLNNNLGHDVGDEAILKIAKHLDAATRPGDFVGRVGGDEFQVILPDTDLEGARATMNRIIEMHGRVGNGHHRQAVTVSAGLAVYFPDTGKIVDASGQEFYMTSNGTILAGDLRSVYSHPDDRLSPAQKILRIADQSQIANKRQNYRLRAAVN